MIPRADPEPIREVPAAHLLMQIRHNLVVSEKPFFRRGCCVQKTATILWRLKQDFSDEAGGSVWHWLLGMAGMAASAAVGAALWPHALSRGIRRRRTPPRRCRYSLNSACEAIRRLSPNIGRRSQRVIPISQQLRRLARAKGIAVSDELSSASACRYRCGSTSHFATLCTSGDR